VGIVNKSRDTVESERVAVVGEEGKRGRGEEGKRERRERRERDLRLGRLRGKAQSHVDERSQAKPMQPRPELYATSLASLSRAV
jgi:hypothetical protein